MWYGLTYQCNKAYLSFFFLEMYRHRSGSYLFCTVRFIGTEGRFRHINTWGFIAFVLCRNISSFFYLICYCKTSPLSSLYLLCVGVWKVNGLLMSPSFSGNFRLSLRFGRNIGCVLCCKSCYGYEVLCCLQLFLNIPQSLITMISCNGTW